MNKLVSPLKLTVFHTLIIAGLLAAIGVGVVPTEIGQAQTGVVTISLDSSVSSIVITSDGKTAYVTGIDGSDARIWVIDTATNTVAKTITDSRFLSLSTLLLTPDDKKLYFSGYSGTMVMNTSDSSITVLPTPGEFSKFAITPNGSKLYVGGGNRIDVLDTATDTIQKTIILPDGSNVTYMAVNPAGTRLYATDNMNSRIHVIDAAVDSVLTTVTVGNRPEGVAVTKDGCYVLVTNIDSDTVSVVKTETNTVIKTIPVGNGPSEVHLSPDGKLAFVTNMLDDETTGKDTIQVIDVEKMKDFAHFSIPVGNNIPGVTQRGVMAFIPGSRRVYLLVDYSTVASFDYNVFPSYVCLPIIINKPSFCPPLFADDFGNPSSGWWVADDGNTLVEYNNGEYRILVRTTQWWRYSLAPNLQEENYIVSVDLRNPGIVNGSYGIAFGVAYENFYTFEIFPDGYYGVYRYQTGGTVVTLSEGFSAAVRQGSASNTIKVERNGASIKAYANNQLLASVTDGSYTGPRRVGVMVYSYDKPNVDIRFDTFRVYPISCASSGQ